MPVDIYVEINENKEFAELFMWLTWKWFDLHPGKVSMRMALAAWSELEKMCSLLKKVYCIFKNNN